jgi:hypothetical protein
MTSVTEVHDVVTTLKVEVLTPGHEPRVTTPLFTRTRLALLAQRPTCYICNQTAEQSGHPLEAHHYPIERSFAGMMDWELVKPDFPSFDWASFDGEADPYKFIDDMMINGLILCKAHHTGPDEGIHATPHSVWIAQRYAKEGYKFSAVEIIHHGQ